MGQPTAVRAPGAWPVLGRAPALMRRPLRFLTSLPELGPLVQLRLGPLSAYIVTTPELTRQVLVTGAQDFERGRFSRKLTRTLGAGLATTSGQQHRTQRRMLQPAFSRTAVAACAEPMRSAAESVLSEWTPGRVIDINKAMDAYASDVVARSLFGSQVAAPAAVEFRHSLPGLLRDMVNRTLLPEWWAGLPTPGNRRAARDLARVDAAAHAAITAYRAADRGAGDLLSLLVAARDEDGTGLSDTQVRDQMVTFTLAGVETTGATLAWFFHELAHHPEVERRVLDEIDAVLGGRAPALDDLPALTETTHALLECTRLYASWIQMRRATRPVVLDGVELPAGTEVIYSPYLLHHDPRWFPAPEAFDPDRWNADRAGVIPNGAYVAFSAGVHKCIGESFAFLEAVTFAVMACQRWRLRPVPGAPVRPVATGVVHPKGLVMSVTPR
ncbi:cytochrome P450 [Actinokineospora diospyrosa]|uniref:Cytochrome P450 n=1 Tax=Actinokineospora diospyrosa TaxID=103728 RepID=A0ABT1IMM2_9PSEU|nr:cytochrome P450 [Actinokineospora diospyrosa]MCP2273911.1 Cytochrome P450 [Actinokineospora diospyrosa]